MKRLLFVVPDLGGHPSGGTLYNAALLRELRALGFDVVARESAAFAHEIDDGTEWLWIDSLYFPQLEALLARARVASSSLRVGVVLHYLPTLVQNPDAKGVDLGRDEALALASSDALLVTSEYMRSRVVDFGYPRERCCVVTPGSDFDGPGGPSLGGGVRALMVAHVVPGKGIWELLDALARQLEPVDPFTLSIAGDLGVDAVYVERCRSLVAMHPELARCVRFLGLCSRARLQQEFARHNAFVSASRMEAYGMALAEARVRGLPILASSGGNVAEHVAREWGGALVQTIEELAACCLELARDPVEHAARCRLARQTAPKPRPWALAAQEFANALRVLDALSLASEIGTNSRRNARTTA